MYCTCMYSALRNYDVSKSFLDSSECKGYLTLQIFVLSAAMSISCMYMYLIQQIFAVHFSTGSCQNTIFTLSSGLKLWIDMTYQVSHCRLSPPRCELAATSKSISDWDISLKGNQEEIQRHNQRF